MKKALFRSILMICVIVFVVSGGVIAKEVVEGNKSAAGFSKLADAAGRQDVHVGLIGGAVGSDENGKSIPPIAPQAPEAPLDPRVLALRALAERNPDLVGWIKIDDTQIDYPVMQSRDDLEYYLHRDFEKQKSDYGVPFIGAFCDPDKPTDNILIYGHHMKNGSMFAGLMGYEKQAFYQTHPVIYFDTRNALGEYAVIAAFKVSANAKGFQYTQFTDATRDPSMFDDYIANVKRLALYDTGISAEYGDKLITLSTCEYTHNNGRMVVVAKKIDTDQP